MLIVLLYHRVGAGKHANTLEMLTTHLEYIKENYLTVLPGDPLTKRTSICLTFDDASYDFYHFIFPLLQKLNLRALLAVPVQYILEKTTVAAEIRLKIPYYIAMQNGVFETKAPFCTWVELEEMVNSGLVEVASHSMSHPNLTYPHLNLPFELLESKRILENRLPQTISSFVYPFGKANGKIHKEVLKHYPFAFRIGSALNYSWDCSLKPLSRLLGDHLLSFKGPLSKKGLLSAFIKTLF
ncbi:MAG: polysaccharide deacetylase family protein [Chlamydiia bacterium]|nr:polysaccharide deacetylase family protein [Chlamydiia bacterium]